MKKALIVSGGWEGHQPEAVADRFEAALTERGLAVKRSSSLTAFDSSEDLSVHSVIIPNWTAGEISTEAKENLVNAVRKGVGLAGIHGGMGDATLSDTLTWVNTPWS